MPSGDSAARGAKAALVVLTLINLFNYLDRYVVASLVESLKKSELALSDAQAGSLMTGFVIVYMLTSPIFGSLGDRRKRPPLLALGVGVWSLATALGGLARSFWGLFAARAAVGVGEAAYGTIAPALLADFFPKDRRGRVFAIFFAAIPIGSAAGYALGGLMDQKFGWRSAFLVAGLPGLALALLCLGLKDPPRGSQDEGGELAPPASPRDGRISAAYSRLWRNRAYRLTVLGYAAYTFALGGLAFWAPAFFERVRGMSKSDATVQFGAIVVATGFIGTFGGGWAGDWFLRRSKEGYLLFSGWVTLAAAPAALVGFLSPKPAIFMPAIVVTELLLFASTGPINSAIVNVVAPGERATAVALSILAIHLLGDVPSPPLIGIVSDATSLGKAFLTLPAVIALAGAIWLYAAKTARDPARG
ncbi:MAG TPA: MFS transporter [Thermoanaerobaculia bacterium]